MGLGGYDYVTFGWGEGCWMREELIWKVRCLPRDKKYPFLIKSEHPHWEYESMDKCSKKIFIHVGVHEFEGELAAKF